MKTYEKQLEATSIEKAKIKSLKRKISFCRKNCKVMRLFVSDEDIEQLDLYPVKAIWAMNNSSIGFEEKLDTLVVIVLRMYEDFEKKSNRRKH